MVKTKSQTNKRKNLSKKNRFEVFKRDKFTCAYCGRKAPDIILEVDHIVPVAKSGDNDITNLITSCIDCNRGKRDVPLNVNETIEKQRIQMELLQEKREQLEMLFEWKKSLSNLDEYKDNLFINYIEDKIKPYPFKMYYRADILKLFKKHKDEDIFKSIDIAANKYLRYDYEDELAEDSVTEFLNKLGGVLVNTSLPPIKQKLAYIKGICRKRFDYIDEQRCSIVLNNYVKALEVKNYDEAFILYDLEDEVIKFSIEAKNLNNWYKTLERWTREIYNWEDEPSNEKENILTEADLEYRVDCTYNQLLIYFEFIKYVSNIFAENQETVILKDTVLAIINYNEMQYEKLCKNEDITDLKPKYETYKSIGLLAFKKNIDTFLKFTFDDVIETYTAKIFNEELYYPNLEIINNIDDFLVFTSSLEEKLQNYLIEQNSIF